MQNFINEGDHAIAVLLVEVGTGYLVHIIPFGDVNTLSVKLFSDITINNFSSGDQTILLRTILPIFKLYRSHVYPSTDTHIEAAFSNGSPTAQNILFS
jgi:hypothetical protein